MVGALSSAEYWVDDLQVPLQLHHGLKVYKHFLKVATYPAKMKAFDLLSSPLYLSKWLTPARKPLNNSYR